MRNLTPTHSLAGKGPWGEGIAGRDGVQASEG